MKKYLLFIFIFLLIICGCSKKEEPKKQVAPKKEKEIVEEVYKDLNNTPIGLYKLNGNKLTRVDKVIRPLEIEKEIDTFQVYFSNDKEITLNKSFADSYYDEYIKYNNIKVGFNIKFSNNDGDISYNILEPKQAFDKWEFLMNYLYDDYANKGKSFYSHIENDQYTDNTLFTAIKLQSSYRCKEIKSKIVLTVFTYDSEDDFIENEYRGNSSFSTNICISDEEC